MTHENWPMNWPDFATSPALLGWPARNRHTAACIHRFSHILRRPPVPVVWFMSESRAVANEHEGHKRTIPAVFEWLSSSRGYNIKIFIFPKNLITTNAYSLLFTVIQLLEYIYKDTPQIEYDFLNWICSAKRTTFDKLITDRNLHYWSKVVILKLSWITCSTVPV